MTKKPPKTGPERDREAGIPKSPNTADPVGNRDPGPGDLQTARAVLRDRIASAAGNYLTLLANIYGSDKGNYWPNRHDYCRVYHELFDGIREKEGLNILEIGLCRGLYEGWTQVDAPSLRMWLDYFPNARVFGFDISDFSFFDHGRCRIIRGDQGSRNDLERLALECGCDFDIIIDDGSHVSRHQQLSLGILFRNVKPGGFYVIEDLDWQPPGSAIEGIQLTREVLAGFIENSRFESAALQTEELVYLDRHIGDVSTFGPDDSPDPLKAKLGVIRKAGANK